ncbi:MAG: hypothetical protein ACRDKU_07335 [Gaiellaceae bacterium]
MNFLDRVRARLRGKEPDPAIGTQIGLIAGGAVIADVARDPEPAQDGGLNDYGWSGDHMSGGSDFGGGGGFDGGGGGDMGGAGGV